MSGHNADERCRTGWHREEWSDFESVQQEVSDRNFGLLIAYLIPGFIVLWGLGFVSPVIYGWLDGTASTAPSLGGFLYVTVASIGAGMAVSAARWLLIDTLHHATGLAQPAWDDSRLQDQLSAYRWVVDNYYRYYQFYANTFVANTLSIVLWLASPNNGEQIRIELMLALIATQAVLLAGSRSALSRYYRRSAAVMTHLNGDPQ